MKYILLLSVISLASCKKCYQCGRTYSGSTVYNYGTPLTDEVCDKTRAEIKQLEKTESFSYIDDNGETIIVTFFCD